MTAQYHDYLLRYRLTDQALALQALAALQAQGLVGAGDTPGWMLGDPIEAGGEVVAYGRAGAAAASYTGEDGTVVAVPARGDPAWVYLAIRTTREMPFTAQQLAAFGLEAATAENAGDWTAVLGVFA